MEIVHKRQIEEDLPQKISAVKLGFTQNIFPDLLFRFKNTPEFYPVGSLPFQKIIACNEGYGMINVSHDRFGLRNQDEKWRDVLEKSNIFVLGDSFTYGACVEDNFTIPSNIQKYTKINSINLGQGANSSYENAAILKSLIDPIIKKSNHKNTVVLIFDDYDGENHSIFRNNEKRNLLLKTSSIVSVSNQNQISPSSRYLGNLRKFVKRNIKTTEEIKRGLIEESKYPNKTFSKTFKNSSFYYTLTLIPLRDSIKSLMTKSYHKESIKLLADICKNKCKPVVAYIPNSDYWKIYDNSVKYFNFNTYKMDLKNTSKKFGIKFIDGSKVINKNSDSNYSPKGFHLSIEGYKKISTQIANEINQF